MEATDLRRTLVVTEQGSEPEQLLRQHPRTTSRECVLFIVRRRIVTYSKIAASCMVFSSWRTKLKGVKMSMARLLTADT
jgi:hypothetical protein